MPAINSSNLAAAEYDDQRAMMTIEFRNGGIYEYRCPRDIYEALIASTSPGGFFHRHIRNVYQTIKVA